MSNGLAANTLTLTLTNAQKRHSRNPSHLENLKKVQINGSSAGRSSENVLSSLRATAMVESKPYLPAELIATILDYLPVPDLLRFARVSRRLREMVYDDTRWIQKLKSMGAWNETEARQRVEEAMKRRTDAQSAKHLGDAGRGQASTGSRVAGHARRHGGSVTLFDAGVEEERHRKLVDTPATPQHRKRADLADGFDELTISGTPTSPSAVLPPTDPTAALHVFRRVRSIRGYARQEFAKIYGALGPIYLDLAQTTGHLDAQLFRVYRDPEQQAQILANLKRFAQCDLSGGWEQREDRLESMIVVFENAVVREFQQGYAAGDVTGRMHRYAHVLFALNGGNAAIDFFISNHPLMTRTQRLGKSTDCLEGCAPGHVDLTPSQRFFEQLATIMVQQAEVIDSTFPPNVDVLTPLWTRACEEIVAEYLAALFSEAHARGSETYVKAVAGTFGQALRLVASLKPTKASPEDFAEKSKQAMIRCFDKHIDLYLTQEFEVFRSKAESEVGRWEKDLSEQEATAEAFFMSNVNRQAAKRDFLSSFKKVVMMPVNVFPAFSSTKQANVASRSSANMEAVDTAYQGGRPMTPSIPSTPPLRSGTPTQEPPTTELAAKTAILNSRLEGIKSLFSIEVALNLTHLAKASIERATLMIQTGGTDGKEAKKLCSNLFVTLVEILGSRHIRNGFDKAIRHLGEYNPREVRKFKEQTKGGEALSEKTHIGVEALVTFLELVNVGDLIQQMVDVFYSQELIAAKLIDRDDFLDPAVKDKKKFEQMLDERVAAGLNKGIDVLMDEVEYICATTQVPTDFNPSKDEVVDIGPSSTAKQIIDMISGHTGMLVGSTDKNMLDVFNQEVGLRLFTALCKHFKRQRISVEGSIKLISDINHYSAFITSLRQKPLLPYYEALREMSQIYLVYIDPPAAYFGGGGKGKRASILPSASNGGSTTQSQAKELATIIADSQRYHGIFPAEEVYEFAERRADWYLVKGDVERAMYGVGCSIM